MHFELFRNQFVFTAQDKEDAGLDIDDQVPEDEFEQTLIRKYLEPFTKNQKPIDSEEDFESLIVNFLQEPVEKEGYDFWYESDWNCKRIDDERGEGIEFTTPREFMVYLCIDKVKYCEETENYCMPKRGYAIEIDYCIESRSFRVGFDCDQSRENFIYPPDSMIEIIGSMMASNQIKTCSD